MLGDTETTVTVMSTVLSSVGSVVTAAVGWLGDFADVIAENDIILLLAVAIPLVGLGIGLLKRMISL